MLAIFLMKNNKILKKHNTKVCKQIQKQKCSIIVKKNFAAIY